MQGPYVFTAAGTSLDGVPKTLGAIAAKPGLRVRVLKVAICGDSDATSGSNRFVADDGQGTSFSWACGQQGGVGATHTLSPTPVAGASRGWTYLVVNHLGAIGAGVTVTWDYHFDWDGLYCGAPDEDGKPYSDPASSVRAWVKYQYE